MKRGMKRPGAVGDQTGASPKMHLGVGYRDNVCTMTRSEEESW